MIHYLVILLDDTSVSFCLYDTKYKERSLIPLETLRKGILFALKENLSINFIYPDYSLPEEYQKIINEVGHFCVKPFVPECYDADAVVINGWDLDLEHRIDVPVILRTEKQALFDNYLILPKILELSNRVDLVITDIESFNDDDFMSYKNVLSFLSDTIESLYVKGESPQLNILTDRMMLRHMNNCGAGDTSITLAPNGLFYICPAFYYDDNKNFIGDVDNGVNIKNSNLYKLSHAPICRHCDAWQCRRCVWMNERTTLEVNTPSRQQCVVAHLERNSSRTLLSNIRKHGEFLPEFDEIPEIDYLDPFEKRKEWK